MKEEELSFCSACKLRQMLMDKDISPSELCQFFIKRIESINPTLHAFHQITYDEAIEASKRVEEAIMRGEIGSPLLGIPIGVADLFDMKGYPTSFGSQVLVDDICEADSHGIGVLKKAGAVIIGKLNVSEFSLYPSLENRLHDPGCNPWNVKYSPGSLGNAAALAAGLVPITITSDMHAGIRVSSSFCGTFGLKTSRGLIPTIRKTLLPLSEKEFYQKGPMTRYVEDAALALDVFSQKVSTSVANDYYQKSLKRGLTHSLRIGWSKDLGFVKIDQEVLGIVQKAIATLESLGHDVEEIDVGLDEGVLMHYKQIWAADRVIPLLSLKNKKANYWELFTDYTKKWMKYGEQVKGVEYSVSLVYTDWLKDHLNHLFSQYDLIITPTVPVPPFKIPLKNHYRMDETELFFWSFTIPFNMSGHPAVNIPCGTTRDGLPVGFQAASGYFKEALLLQFAASLEPVFNWTSKKAILGHAINC